MKKVLFIGDIHGRGGWKPKALDGIKWFDEVVFLGDYVDSFDVRPVVQLQNLKDIIAFARKKGKEKVTLLLGNHDYAYIHGLSGISGYQFEHAHEYKKIFDDHRELFKIAWGYRDEDGNYTLATHAGLTKDFWDHTFLEFEKKTGFIKNVSGYKDLKYLDPHEILNYLIDKTDVMWQVGPIRWGTGTPGPLWADISELLGSNYPGINQVFGHTPDYSVRIYKDSSNNLLIGTDLNFKREVGSVLLSL